MCPITIPEFSVHNSDIWVDGHQRRQNSNDNGHLAANSLQPGLALHGDVERVDQVAPSVALVHPRGRRVH